MRTRDGLKGPNIQLYFSPVSYSLELPGCLLYTSDAADEEDSVDLGGRRIIKKKKKKKKKKKEKKKKKIKISRR